MEDLGHHFNKLTQGTRITNCNGDTTEDKVFFVIGDQLSSLPGWQEGAIASAINALNRSENDNIPVASLKELPDTKLMVEGV